MSSDKTFVVLSQEEVIRVEQICLDELPEEALEFVKTVIAPQIHKAVPCVDKALQLYRPQSGGA